MYICAVQKKDTCTDAKHKINLTWPKIKIILFYFLYKFNVVKNAYDGNHFAATR